MSDSSISLNTCILILKEHHLLKSSAIQDAVPTKMDYCSSVKVKALDLLIYQWLKIVELLVM